MDEEQRKKNLKAMRQALKEGRTQRRSDMRQMDERLYEESYELRPGDRGANEGLSRVINEARSREMLHEVRAENRLGEQSKGILAIKEGEEYQKRPSVRALKKYRDVGGRSI